jgi:hypothetical protein
MAQKYLNMLKVGFGLVLRIKENFIIIIKLGSWYLEGERIVLAQKVDSRNFQISYQALELSESHLVVQTVATENQYV